MSADCCKGDDLNSFHSDPIVPIHCTLNVLHLVHFVLQSAEYTAAVYIIS